MICKVITRGELIQLARELVLILGSHAALTCHIVVMRHVVTGVVSVGHFDNFCCWQFGDDSSAHKDGINIMLEEIGNYGSKKYISYFLVTEIDLD